MKLTKIISCLLLLSLCISLCCCSTDSESLTAEYTRSASVPKYDFLSGEEITPENYSEFVKSYLNFASNMLKGATKDESVILSPLSLYTALSMTANGAGGKTLKELEKVLGDDLNIEKINTFIHYLNERVKALNSEEGFVSSANSLWIRDDYSVKAQFLQTIVNYFDAEIYRTQLDGKNGAKKINDWISEKTDNEIEDMLGELSKDTALVLLNALLFDDEWTTPYEENDIYEATFLGTKGDEHVSFMESNEMLLESKDAKGIIKSYKNTPCKFVAILPNENISVDEYVNSLSASKLQTLFASASGINRCISHLPEFELHTKLDLNDTIKSMGANLMFTADANFDALTMNEGLFVSDVIEESFIEVTPKGTKAGSSTAVSMKDSASAPQDFEEVIFDRPFVFMVVENEYNLPLFIGTVKSIH